MGEGTDRGGDGDRRPSTEHLESQLQIVSSARIGENQITWTIFGIFWATQVLLVGVLFQGGQFPPNPVLGFGVSFLGVVMSVAWALTQHRSLLHLQRHEDIIKLIEMQLVDRGDLLPDHQMTMQDLYSGPRARTVMRVCCWAAAIAWLVSLVVFAGGFWTWITCRG